MRALLRAFLSILHTEACNLSMGYLTIGSSTEPVAEPKSLPCSAIASDSERLATQSAANRAGLEPFISRR